MTSPVPETEFSEQFVLGMRNRMNVSYFKYGAVADAYPHRVDAIASLERRLMLYREGGNTEWLMDVANFAMIEFMHPRHPQAHFRATDSDESPGRKNIVTGNETAYRNKDIFVDPAGVPSASQ